MRPHKLSLSGWFVLAATLAACSSGNGSAKSDALTGGEVDALRQADATIGSDLDAKADSGVDQGTADSTPLPDVIGPDQVLSEVTGGDALFGDLGVDSKTDVVSPVINPEEWDLKGSATITDGKIVITNDVQDEVGAVWYKNTFDLGKVVSIRFKMYFGTKDDEGADGMAFVFSLEPMANQNGEGIGYGGIEPSLVIEIDTYPNDGEHLGGDQHDPLPDHIAVMRNGNPDHVVAANVDHVLGANIEDDKEHDVQVVWEPATKLLKVYFDDMEEPVVTSTIDDLADLFPGTQQVYLGITGSTGLYSNLQYVVPVTLSGQTPPLTSVCKGTWTLHGTAVLVGNDIRLTEAAGNQAGAAWCDGQIDLSGPLDLGFKVRLGDLDEDGADGIVLVIGKAPIVADIGQGIGYSGIGSSIAFEIDTYPNDGEHLGDDLNDPLSDHVAVVADGISDHSQHASFPVVEIPNIEDGQAHSVRVTWDPAQKELKFYLDDLAKPLLSQVVDIVATHLEGESQAYIGFTSATGVYFNEHYILP